MRGGATEVNETQKWAMSKKKVENHCIGDHVLNLVKATRSDLKCVYLNIPLYEVKE
jgi:hypothetical protein